MDWDDIENKPSAFETNTTSITDATTVGRAVLTAVDAAAARTAIGAGTSSLSAMSAGEATTGTATTARAITAAVINGAVLERVQAALASGTVNAGAKTITFTVGANTPIVIDLSGMFA